MAADPPGTAGGFCHCGKPTVMENGKTVWPFTLSNDWCGEFQCRDDRASRLLSTKYMSQSKDEVIGAGGPCPKCSTPMARKTHPPGWKPKPTSPYYFRYWDKCEKCRRIQHYEDAKCYLSTDGPRVTERTSDWQGTPAPYDGAAPWE